MGNTIGTFVSDDGGVTWAIRVGEVWSSTLAGNDVPVPWIVDVLSSVVIGETFAPCSSPPGGRPGVYGNWDEDNEVRALNGNSDLGST